MTLHHQTSKQSLLCLSPAPLNAAVDDIKLLSFHVCYGWQDGFNKVAADGERLIKTSYPVMSLS